MQERVTIGQRGVITIPTSLREAFGLKPDDLLIIEGTPEGLLLRPAVAVAVEMYTDARLTEFARDDALLTALLDRMDAEEAAAASA